jgi:glycosyltransferase involved in cell wall biosynthesis
MEWMNNKRICIVPKLEGLGGPASFQRRLIPVLQEQGYLVHHDLEDKDTSVVLVNGGTRQLLALWRAKQRGVRIVQRLAQVNWVHRHRFSGLAFTYRSERNNLLLSLIRRFFADHLIYQSQFVQSIWEATYGKVNAHASIIYNGVDVEEFSPAAAKKAHERPIKIAVIEGHLGEGNEIFLANAVNFGEALAAAMQTAVVMHVAGDVPNTISQKWHRNSDLFQLEWRGVVSRQEIIALNHSSHFLFSAELNGGCPNAVIEALACGTPVIGYATGALPELLQGGAGISVPYGGDHWRLDLPDIQALVHAAEEMLDDLPSYQAAARKKALENYAIEAVSADYIKVILG